jgi:hypothetical protein
VKEGDQVWHRDIYDHHGTCGKRGKSLSVGIQELVKWGNSVDAHRGPR